MNLFSRARPSQIPLRGRLTLWYLFTLGIIVGLFATFLYLQLQRSLFEQLDANLQLVATQMLLDIDTEGSQLRLIEGENIPNPNNAITLYLLAPNGDILDKVGLGAIIQSQTPLQLGYSTFVSGDDHWRIYNQEVTAVNTSGWIQAVQSLDPIEDTLDRLLAQMAIGVPLALALAGLGGFFLASRALRPIDRITRTAQAISASDLHQRLNYDGPADEVGRLAATFDAMVARLQTAFERERRFTGDAAHELRTPLAALKGRIGVTLNQTRQPEVYRETLADMEQQVDRLIRLSNDLLFMARLDRGQVRPRFEQIVLADFLGAVVDQIRPLAQTKAITLTETIPAGLTLHGDMDLLIRLFFNLLDNAVKYTSVNGYVTIVAEQKEAKAIISIIDTGPGIPSEHLPHLFERFYRVESDRSRQGQNSSQSGTGLGLAIAHEIARAHGGELMVRSELGVGTTVIVVLPHQG